eukprot:TRINITY_DN26839_c0_g1_i1.p1 TRINITY_DN26839_c0_g1~~TRINITY_DN26839_c0_g1_i1.p1  ORF type:complete len:182 (-),score=32.40 TRINITY_DN26839_c0_g1_i1:220-765(-)
MGCAASVQPSVRLTQVVPDDDAEILAQLKSKAPKGMNSSQRRIQIQHDKYMHDPACYREPPQGKAIPKFKLNAAIISEPRTSESLNSYYFMASKEDCLSGHPLPPCARLHFRHVRRLGKALKQVAEEPSLFIEDIEERRQLFDQQAKIQDLIENSNRTYSTCRDLISSIKMGHLPGPHGDA